MFAATHPRRSLDSFSGPALVPCSHNLLRPLKCTVPSHFLSYNQIAPVTPLECALTNHSQITENTTTLSLAVCAVTRLSRVSSLECAVPRNSGGGGLCLHLRYSPLVHPERNRRATTHSPLHSSSFFSHSCALFCTFLHFFALAQNLTLFFSNASALFAKNHPGWGEGGRSAIPKEEL